MTATLTKVPTGHLRLSRIIYFTDLQRNDSREIPIGVVAEASLDQLRAVGMALRPQFSAAELELMGPVARALLSRPMDVLWPEMKGLFGRSQPGSALDDFATLHTSSLSVLAPSYLKVPLQWLMQSDVNKLKGLVGDRMKVTLIDAYYDLLFPPRGGNVEDPAVEEMVLKRAA